MKLINGINGAAWAMLIALAGCATQNPPAKIDTERQAKIERAFEGLKNASGQNRGDAVCDLS